jgi:hypothetical protein
MLKYNINQWPITESARIQTTTARRQHRTKQTTAKEATEQRKNGSAKALYTQTRLTKISADLQTAFAAGAEGQWLKEQLNMVKLRMLRAGTRMAAVSRTEGQCLVPLKTFINNSESK